MSTKQCTSRAVIIIFVAASLLFFNTLNAGFVSDDFVLVQRTATEGFFSSWGGEAGNTFFRPVTTFTYYLDFQLWGTNPAGYHLTNIFWHLLCSIAVFILFYLLMKEIRLQKPFTYALLSSVLFLALASHSESVAWISGRTDIIATSFCIISLIFFNQQLNKPSALNSVLALFFFVTALLAKESVIITPLLWAALLIYKLDSSREHLRRNLLLIGVSMLCTVFYLIFRIYSKNSLTSGMQYAGILELSPMILAESIVRYSLRVLVPPFPLALRSFLLGNPIIVLLFTAILILPISVYAIKKASFKENKLLFLMAGCYLISLLPVIGMKVSLFDTQSERFLYLPGVFASGFLTLLIVYVLKESKLSVIILTCTVIFQGVFLHRSNRNWVQAGKLCSTIAESMAEYDPDSVYILAIPDSFRGAYVFRNGLNEAVEILTGKDFDYILLNRISSYGDTLRSNELSNFDLEFDNRTSLAWTNGRMERVELSK